MLQVPRMPEVVGWSFVNHKKNTVIGKYINRSWYFYVLFYVSHALKTIWLLWSVANFTTEFFKKAIKNIIAILFKTQKKMEN
jgi:hypothetical protein